MLDGWDGQRHLGLISYGHRRKGDCDDIQTLTPVGPLDREQMKAQVATINPKGKTPITAAVRAAADALRFREERATVILVSDGVETCNADPCALGKELDAAGVDFTAHVIGFDLAGEDTAALACLARETGGKFLSAENADELQAAIEVVAAPPPPTAPTKTVPPATYTFEATDGNNGPVIQSELSWLVESTDDPAVLSESLKDARPSLLLPLGDYAATATRGVDGATVSKRFRVTGSATRRMTLELPPYLPAATLEAAPSVLAGAMLDVAWTGPDHKGDYVTVVPAGTKDKTTGPYGYTSQGSPIELRVPDQAGNYELRYALGAHRKVIARLALKVTAASATLSAPGGVAAGGDFDIEWTGPANKNDYVTIVPVDDKEGRYGAYAYTSSGSPVTLKAPDAPGEYELRYSMGQSRETLVRRTIEVTAVSATLNAAEAVAAGSEFEVEWTGPNNASDYLTVVPAGAKEGKYTSYAYTKSGSPAQLRAPDQAGNYELRYSMGQSRQTLVRRAIEVTEVAATLSAADEVAAGSEFEVEWTGPNNNNDFVTVVPADAKERKLGTYAHTKKGSPLELTAPDQPGEYELRYAMGKSRDTLVRRPLVVTAVSATLTTETEVPAGGVFNVEWTGPNNKNDFVTVVPVGTKERKLGTYARTKKGSPLELTAPDQPGKYELRYAMGKSRETLERRAILVTPVTATLSVAAQVAAGERLEVEWTGPNNARDFIAIVPVGAKQGATGNHHATKNGSPLEIRAPKAIGKYEVRYVMGRSRITLSTQPLAVVAP